MFTCKEKQHLLTMFNIQIFQDLFKACECTLNI